MGEDVSDIKSGTDDADCTDMWYPFFGYDRNETIRVDPCHPCLIFFTGIMAYPLIARMSPTEALFTF